MSKKSKNIEWQSYSYSFPKNGYASLLTIERESTATSIMVPDNDLHIFKSAIIKSIDTMNQDEESEDFKVDYNPIALELELDRLLPLSKTMWNYDGLDCDILKRISGFADLIRFPDWYWVLVMPIRIEKGAEIFHVAMPIKTTITDEELNKIMYMIKFPVDPQATHFGLYRYKSCMQFDENRGNWIEKRKDWNK